jgi:hypothetical protein
MGPGAAIQDGEPQEKRLEEYRQVVFAGESQACVNFRSGWIEPTGIEQLTSRTNKGRRKSVKPSIGMGFWLMAAVFQVLTTWIGTEAWAYESAPVKEGATVRGTVTVTGTIPAPKEFELRRFPDYEYCGRLSNAQGYRFLTEVWAKGDGSLKDAVVVVEDVERGKPFTFTEAEVEASLCRFLPFVAVVNDTRRITVFNRDPVPHDIQGYASDQTGENLLFYRPSLQAGGTTDVVQLSKGQKAFTMQCSLHPYMQNWGYAVDNPYYAVTDAKGSFSIEDLPPGTYRLKAWHPVLGTQEKKVTVTANETVSLELSFEANY